MAQSSGKLALVVMAVLLITIPVTTACGGDDESPSPSPTPTETLSPSPTPTETPEPIPTQPPGAGAPTVGSTWEYDVTYGDINEAWTFTVVGMEMFNSVDTLVAELVTDSMRTRQAPDTAQPVDYPGEMYWIDTAAYDIEKRQLEVLAAGGSLEIMTTVLYTTTKGEPGMPYSEGKTWSWDQTVTLDPPVRPERLTNWVATIVGTEDITVPAGTFSCYKIERSQVIISEELCMIEWWAIDESIPVPVRLEDLCAYQNPEIWELTAYNP